MLYAYAKMVESELGVKPEKKRKPDKNKKTKWKINIEKKLKQWEERCRYLTK